MELFEQKLKQLKTEIKLGTERKQLIKERLLAVIAQNQNVRAVESYRQPVQKWSLIQILFTHLKPMQIIAIVAILAMLGGGTSFAAESALPGDLLYPVKVKFNEEVRAAFAISPDAQANWEAQRAERRLEEAVGLAVKSQINAKAEAQVEENFETHAQRVEDRIAALEAKGKTQAAIDLASKFEASLEAHEQVLSKINGNFSEAVKAQIKPLKTKVGAAKTEVAKTRAKLEIEAEAKAENRTETEIKASAQGKIKAADNVIASAQTVLENWESKLGAQAVIQAQVKLKNAQDFQAQAKAKFDAGQYNEAFALAGQAIRKAQEARTTVEIQGRFNLQLKIDDNATASGKVEGETIEVEEHKDGNRNRGGSEVKLFFEL